MTSKQEVPAVLGPVEQPVGRLEPERDAVVTPLPDCNRGNKCPWSEECKANDWRETCRRCGLRSQGSGQ